MGKAARDGLKEHADRLPYMTQIIQNMSRLTSWKSADRSAGHTPPLPLVDLEGIQGAVCQDQTKGVMVDMLGRSRGATEAVAGRSLGDPCR